MRMSRRRMRAGEVGTIRIVVLANGQIQANARVRDELGALCRLKVVRATEQDARSALDEQADLIRHGSAGPTLSAYSTIAEAAAVFLDDKRSSQTVEVSTIETYEFSVNNVIIPECGNLLLTDLTVLRCNRILQHIRDTKSLSAARKARSMSSQICATGIEHGVLAFNPVRDARARVEGRVFDLPRCGGALFGLDHLNTAGNRWTPFLRPCGGCGGDEVL
jgi:hypothetical protein